MMQQSSGDSILVDPAMPALAVAQDLPSVQRALTEGLGCTLRVQRCELLRHKPGRRFLICYHVEVEGRSVRWIGKGRAKGIDRRAFDLQKQLFEGAFGSDAADQIHVPRPVACVPELNMWLQEAVPGTVLTNLLDAAQGPALCKRAAEAAHKLHAANVDLQRTHSVADELAILHQRLLVVATAQPRLASPVAQLLELCDAAGRSLIQTPVATIHRDFYPAQLLVDRDRLYLVDLDTCCAGDPMLDYGNFLAHLAEHSLREPGEAKGLAICEKAMLQFVLEHYDHAAIHRLRYWRALSLARHVHISTLFPRRMHVTEKLLAMCYQDLIEIIR